MTINIKQYINLGLWIGRTVFLKSKRVIYSFTVKVKSVANDKNKKKYRRRTRSPRKKTLSKSIRYRNMQISGNLAAPLVILRAFYDQCLVTERLQFNFTWLPRPRLTPVPRFLSAPTGDDDAARLLPTTRYRLPKSCQVVYRHPFSFVCVRLPFVLLAEVLLRGLPSQHPDSLYSLDFHSFFARVTRKS